MRNYKTVFLSLLIITSSSCAFTKQQMSIQAAPVEASRCAVSGRGKALVLNVSDEREDSSFIGKRIDGGAAIKDTGTTMPTFKQALQQSFQNCGFKVTEAPPQKAIGLKVALRSLSYTVMDGIWTGTVRMQAAAQVSLLPKEDWSKMIREERELKKAVVPSAKENERWMNELISNLVAKIVGDKELSAKLIP
ncbi:MAG: hypothetical protein HQM15_09125 [Deltaproteobacteria bacterium]|nr:hypothetical protein [Deltaproteobacteria bacterium]